LVYGEAGSRIIAKNMEKGNEINPMLPGTKSMFIFGFCDIRNFTDTTEVLEEGVMIFVNEIGDLVHSTVNTYSGAANKNVGDAFLLVWKLDQQDILYNELTEEMSVIKSHRVSQLADMSLVSFLLLISGLRKSKKMVKYNEHPGLNKRIENYEVRLGLGLHLGYAIEGAIGSYYKIDASYLSPNVRMSERLEGATKPYGAPILISGELEEHLSPATQALCRQVDYVEMNGIPDPVRLYTVDVDPLQIQTDENEAVLSRKEQKVQRIRQRLHREELRENAFKGEI
jgi:class 3 adenylate cyclase